jgi:hypothetical protein
MTEPVQLGPADDRETFRRTIRFAAIAIITVLLLAEMPVAFRVVSNASLTQVRLFVYSIPQAFMLGLLVGFPVGVFASLGGRVISHRSTTVVLSLTIASSIGSVVMLTSVVPAANRAARQELGGVRNARPARNELTFMALREQRDLAARAGFRDEARHLDVYLHSRWALSCAPPVFVLLALSLVSRRQVAGLILGGAFCAAIVPYYLLTRAAMAAGLHGRLPGFAAAWLPNVVFTFVWAGMELAGTRRRSY